VVNEGFSVKKHVETKAGAADLVTEFDQRVEEILIKKLQEKFPTHKYVQKKKYLIIFCVLKIIDLLEKNLLLLELKQYLEMIQHGLLIQLMVQQILYMGKKIFK
jgi:hypothetical protein